MAGDDMTALEAWRQMAMAENKRAQRNWQGLENDKPVTLREITVATKATPEEPPEKAHSSKALRQHIQRLHLDGLAPDEIVARLACPEAVVWKDLRGLYIVGRKSLSDDYRQLRVARVYALKQQGVAVSKIAVLLGFTSVLLNKDLREMPQDQARAAAVVVQDGENTGRTQNG